jgi:hypothetical protein
VDVRLLIALAAAVVLPDVRPRGGVARRHPRLRERLRIARRADLDDLNLGRYLPGKV